MYRGDDLIPTFTRHWVYFLLIILMIFPIIFRGMLGRVGAYLVCFLSYLLCVSITAAAWMLFALAFSLRDWVIRLTWASYLSALFFVFEWRGYHGFCLFVCFIGIWQGVLMTFCVYIDDEDEEMPARLWCIISYKI